MSILNATSIFDRLSDVPWETTTKIFGNSHASYIGCIVQWWIQQDTEHNSVLESGPTHGYHRQGIGGGLCDAIFCIGQEAVGLLEVEGTRVLDTIDKITKFFQTQTLLLQKLQFAILVIYSYQQIGKGRNRSFKDIFASDIQQRVHEVSAQHPDKSIIVITVSKAYQRQRDNPRQLSEYYWGTTTDVTGILYQQGEEVDRKVYFSQALDKPE